MGVNIFYAQKLSGRTKKQNNLKSNIAKAQGCLNKQITIFIKQKFNKYFVSKQGKIILLETGQRKNTIFVF